MRLRSKLLGGQDVWYRLFQSQVVEGLLARYVTGRVGRSSREVTNLQGRIVQNVSDMRAPFGQSSLMKLTRA
jgi:hypothetical protein